MRFIVPAVLIMVAAIHVLPVVGILGAGKLAQLYGIAVQDPNLELLLRHRACCSACSLPCSRMRAFRPELHGLALLAELVSVVSFLVLAHPASALKFGPSYGGSC